MCVHTHLCLHLWYLYRIHTCMNICMYVYTYVCILKGFFWIKIYVHLKMYTYSQTVLKKTFPIDSPINIVQRESVGQH